MDNTTKVVRKIPNPSGKGGFQERPQDRNFDGRPKNSLKTFVARKLAAMSDKEKENWLKKHGIGGEFQWRMSEGNPSNELTGKDGGPIEIQGVEIKIRK